MQAHTQIFSELHLLSLLSTPDAVPLTYDAAYSRCQSGAHETTTYLSKKVPLSIILPGKLNHLRVRTVPPISRKSVVLTITLTKQSTPRCQQMSLQVLGFEHSRGPNI